MNMSLVRRWLRWGMWGALGVSWLWLMSWAAVPRWVQWQVEQQATQALGRVVTIDEVVFRPWSMVLTLRGLHVAKVGTLADPMHAQLSVDELEINASVRSLFLWAPVADAIVVRNPHLQLLHRGQGRFDIDDVLARLASAGSPGAGIPRMSLFNIQVLGGVLSFRDEPLSITHSLTDLQLEVPFLSNIGGRREVATHPRLAFKLNGSHFDSDAQTTPFAADRDTHARFQIKALDATPYLPYWPAAWPVRPSKGQLQLDLAVDFRQQDKPEVVLSGRVAVRDVLLNERFKQTGMPLLRWKSLDLNIESWRPLDGVLKVAALSLDQPVLDLRRDTAGVLNVVRLQNFFSPAVSAQPKPLKPGEWLALNHLEISGGQLNWHDAATNKPVNLSLTHVDSQARALSWPIRQVASLEGKAQLADASLSWAGSTDLSGTQVRLSLRELALKTAAPYWAQWLHPELTGQLTADVSLDWRAAVGAKTASLSLKSPQIRVSNASIGAADQPDVAWSELALDQVVVDVLQQKASVGRVALTRPVVNMSRNTKGRWTGEDWLVATKSTGPAKSLSPPWQTSMGALQIKDGTLNLDDRWVPGLVPFHVRNLNLLTGTWQPLLASSPMTPIQLNFGIGTAQRETGTLGFAGAYRWPVSSFGASHLAPLQLKGQLKLIRFPLHRLKAYAAERVNFDLRRADVSYDGGLDLTWPAQGLGLDARGQLMVENLRAFDAVDGQALVDIEALNVNGLNFSMRDGAMRQLKISDIALRDFFARVAIDEQGQLNLQRMLKTQSATDPPTQPPAADTSALIELGPMVMLNGRVAFSDRFIRPRYSADITDLVGRLGALSNLRHGILADISLRGRVAGSASLEVNGGINPLTRPVGLDVRGQVTDLELPQLSPYSSKYAGYGIERGKLSAQVHYRIGAEGQLEATHQLTLNQLRFGEKSERADAPNLPVKLAVALLADRNGVIDLNLPISGSINDPDFQVGPIVWRMVLNLIGKAILSPFSLLSGAFASEEQLQQIDFAPGQADLDAAAQQKLEAVAKLLMEKPDVRLTVVGQADLATEREAWRQVTLRAMVREEKRRLQLREPKAASLLSELSQDEYLALLQALYRRSPLPKPLNALGLVKALPLADMEALLLAGIAVEEADMRDLAQARAEQVRAALLALKVPSGQLFLGASILSGHTGAGPFVPQVRLVLSTD
jgi:outer membrane protein OmpA-like peptidoglycan-associated protein